MRIQEQPRFETQPRKEFFTRPPVKTQVQQDWPSLIRLGIIVGGFCLMAQILHHEPDKVASPQLAPPMPDPTPALVRTPAPQVRRAQLVSYPLNWRGWVSMPDGTPVDVTYRGTVPDFNQLPKHPGWHDMYRLTNYGTSWIYMTPAGFSHPTWVDP